MLDHRIPSQIRIYLPCPSPQCSNETGGYLHAGWIPGTLPHTSTHLMARINGSYVVYEDHLLLAQWVCLLKHLLDSSLTQYRSCPAARSWGCRPLCLLLSLLNVTLYQLLSLKKSRFCLIDDETFHLDIVDKRIFNRRLSDIGTNLVKTYVYYLWRVDSRNLTSSKSNNHGRFCDSRDHWEPHVVQ